jgi:hypothetical protein
MRINVNNALLPGVQSEHTLRMGSEVDREEVFANGTYVGEIVYVQRKGRGGSEFGWRPAKAPRVKLTNKVDAIRRLPAMLPYLLEPQVR